ncbi:hypothetical protein [Bacillus pacificus]
MNMIPKLYESIDIAFQKTVGQWLYKFWELMIKNHKITWGVLLMLLILPPIVRFGL